MFQTLIDSTTLAGNINKPGWTIIDCRYDLADPHAGRKAYLSSHIPGAVFADVHDDLSGPPLTDRGRHPLPSQEHLQSFFRQSGINIGSQVVAYDNSNGAFAGRLWWLLRYLGHLPVAVLDGGFSAWTEAGNEVSAGEEKNPPGNFTGEALSDLVITVDEVPGAPLLVDSRDAVRYRGEEEPIDRQAGHIPGAVNRPWKSNLDDRGYFKGAGQLHDEFLQLLKDNSPGTAVYYCGSGVTACHNILASVHAGLPMPRLYAGSWSDWCSDPSRPAVRGDNP